MSSVGMAMGQSNLYKTCPCLVQSHLTQTWVGFIRVRLGQPTHLSFEIIFLANKVQ